MLILVQLLQIYKCILVLCNAIVDEPTISHAEEVPPTDHSITFSMTHALSKFAHKGRRLRKGTSYQWASQTIGFPFMENRSAATVTFVNLLAVSH
jgi:hypothetical protein